VFYNIKKGAKKSSKVLSLTPNFAWASIFEWDLIFWALSTGKGVGGY
jgi:hypothetical protein